MNTDRIMQAAKALAQPFTTAHVLAVLKMSDNPQHKRRVRDALRAGGFVSGRSGRDSAWVSPSPILSPADRQRVERDAEEFKAGDINREPQKFWRNTTAPRITVTIAGPQGSGKTMLREFLQKSLPTGCLTYGPPHDERRVSVDFIELQTDVPAGDAMDLETINAALQEQLQRSIETGDDLVRQLREEREISSLLNHAVSEMTERCMSALGAAGFLTAFQVQKRAEEEIERISAKLRAARMRHRGGLAEAKEAANQWVYGDVAHDANARLGRS